MEELVFHIQKVITLLKTELSKEIEACVSKAISEKLKSLSHDASEDRLITTPELQKILSISKSGIDALKRKKLPYYKIGDNVRFKKQEVLEFIQQYQRQEGGQASK